MGIFNDYLVEEDTTINENYTKYIDNPIIADIESYANDYTIFEATLKRDFYEATGILNEEGDQNFFQKIWDKILHVLKTIKEKVASIVNYFSEMWDKHQKEKINKIEMKYYKYYKVSNRADLNNLAINFTLPNIKVFNNGILTLSADVKSMLGEVPNFEKVKSRGGIYFGKDELNLTRNKKNRKGEEVVKRKGKSYIASDIHNYVWGDEKKGEVKYPFKYITPVQLLNIMDFKQDGLKHIKKLKEDLIKEINTQEKQAKSYKKSASKDKDDSAKKLASSYLSLLSDYQTVAVHYFSAFLKEYKAAFNAFVKLYIKGGEKLKQIYGEINTSINPGSNPTFDQGDETRENPNTDKKEESKEESFYDNSYLDAVVETTMFEFGLE